MPPAWLPPRGVGTLGWFHFFKAHRGWAFAIGLVNLVGIAYGFWYYQAQFAVTPWWLWPLVPDSPLAVLFAEAALISFWLGRKPGVLDALAFVGNVQVGLWTCYVLLAYESSFHTLDFAQAEGPVSLNTVLWLGHLGMAALGLVFLWGPRERARAERGAVAWAVAVAAAYYLVQDVVDYWGPDFRGVGCGLRPHTVPCDGREPVLALVTLGLTLLGVAVLAWSTLRRDASTGGRT